MSQSTWYVMQPYRLIDGEIIAGEPVQCRDAVMARRAARQVAAHPDHGAVAFSRRGDPDLGDFDEAEVICALGVVPDDIRSN